jgi:ABC-2 type transport system permease protein
MKLASILLVARRDYLAYVGAWGFWVSLVMAPLIIAVLVFAPVLVSRAEPPRPIAILVDRAVEAVTVADAL